MTTYTCYVAELGLPTMGSLPPHIDDLTPGGNPIGSYLRNASGAAAIDLNLDWSRRGILASQSVSAPLSQDDLLYSLPTVLGPEGLASPPAVGLLLAGSYSGSTARYGLMFDADCPDGSPGHRQGCAIFLSAIWDCFFTEPAPKAQADFLEAAAYIAVHELGHIFNLWHVDDTSFMQRNPNPETLGTYVFEDHQETYLALAASPATAQFVLPGPGQQPFGALAPGYTNDDGSPFAQAAPTTSDLSFRIALSNAELWSFEPVELDIELAVADTAAGPVSIPDEIDPGYPALRIWITRPDGERVRYRPQVRFCGGNGQRLIGAGESFRRDVAIGRQSGGFTFAAPGEYAVQATLDLGGRTIASNSATCLVRGVAPKAADWREADALLSGYDAQRLLRFKRAAPSLPECARLARYADENPSSPTARAIHYALGRSLLQSSTTVVHGDYAAALRRRAVGHLRKFLDSDETSAHRRGVAGGLLDSASRRSRTKAAQP